MSIGTDSHVFFYGAVSESLAADTISKMKKIVLLLLMLTLASLHLSAQDEDIVGLRSRAEAGDRSAQIALAARLDSDEAYEEALKWFRVLADAGDGWALSYVGTYYERGYAVEADSTKAVELYLQAARKGSQRGCNLLIGRHDVPVVDLMESAVSCASGSVHPEETDSYVLNLTHLYQVYYNGSENRKPDPVQAFEYCRRAAEYGYSNGYITEYLVGNMYDYYMGNIDNSVEPDPAVAYMWLERAVTIGMNWAKIEMAHHYRGLRGSLVEPDIERAVALLREASEDYVAKFCLGYIYEMGEGGIPREMKKAIYWYKRAIEEDGEVTSMYNLGLIYLHGKNGVEQSNELGLKYMRMAAEAGYPDALYNMGCYCYNGEFGLRKDLVESLRWHRIAADNGFAAAQNSVGLAYYYGSGVKRNRREARRWITLAAEQGNQLAIDNLRELF